MAPQIITFGDPQNSNNTLFPGGNMNYQNPVPTFNDSSINYDSMKKL